MNPFRRWREEKHLTRAELAAILKTSVSQVQAVETGMVERPYKRFLIELASIAGEELVGQMSEEYAAFRREQRDQALAKLQKPKE